MAGIVGEESHPDEVDLRQQFGTPSFCLGVCNNGKIAKIFTLNNKAMLDSNKEKANLP